MTLKCIHEVLVEDDVCVRFGQHCFQRLKLRLEALHIVGRVFPVQSESYAGLYDLARDADDADDSERVSHLVLSMMALKDATEWLEVSRK